MVHHHTAYGIIFLAFLGLVALFLFLEIPGTTGYASLAVGRSFNPIEETLLADCSDPKILGSDFASSIIERSYVDYPCDKKKALCVTASRDSELPGKSQPEFRCTSPDDFIDSCIAALDC